MTDLLLAHGFFLADEPRERALMRPYPPLGLLSLAAFLEEAGHDVSVFDSTFQTREAFAARLGQTRPAVVGLGTNLGTRAQVVALMAQARAAGAKVVVGGPEIPHHAEEYLRRGADVAVAGEGEETLAELLPRLLEDRPWADVPGLLFLDGGRLVRTPPRPPRRDLDALPWPARHAIDLEPYLAAWKEHHGVSSLSVLTSRGCPYTCRWCSRSVFGETHRRRSAASVADEVQALAERYAPDQVWYVDDVFTIHRGWLLAFADEMERRSLRVPFECISRPERIDDAVADALRRLGCRRLWIGSESGSDRVLQAMDRRMTAADVRAATRRLQARGIEVGLFVMLGYPGEEEADLAATIDHLDACAPDALLTTRAYPIKGTAFYDEVAGALAAPDDWAASSDRDLVVRGARSRLYYRCAEAWLLGSVARRARWRQGRVLGSAAAAARAAAGRFGMRILGAVGEGEVR